MPRKIELPNADDFVRDYLAGKSEKAIAAETPHSRRVIRRILLEHGVQPRNRSEGMYARMAQTSPEERLRLATPAHAARRAKPTTTQELHNRALSYEHVQCKVGQGEEILAQWLRDLGLVPQPQKAVARYNIDLALPPIAVELSFSSCQPNRRLTERSKVKDLTEAEWFVIYIWVRTKHFLSPEAAYYVAAQVQAVERNPALRGEYRVVSGSGELLAAGRSDFDQRSAIPPPRRR